MARMRAIAAGFGFGIVVGSCAAPGAAVAEEAWTNTPAHRWQAQALMQGLNATVLGSRSATFALEDWCRTHRLAEDPKLVADFSPDAPVKPVTAEQRQRLGVSESEPIKYRRVRLRCGTKILSAADNWYVPSRLTPDMNQALETTSTPFGRVVAPLKPYRLTFEAKVLWSPVATPPDEPAIVIPEALFEHRAVLYTRDHLPFSEVDEVYQHDVLGFPPQD